MAATLAAHPGGVYALAFNKSGTALASGGSDHAVVLWEVSARSKTATL